MSASIAGSTTVEGALNNLDSNKSEIMIVDDNLTFTNGWHITAYPTGYKLINAYTIDRPNTEAGNYAIAFIYARSDGYYLQNRDGTLNASVKVRQIWLKV